MPSSPGIRGVRRQAIGNWAGWGQAGGTFDIASGRTCTISPSTPGKFEGQSLQPEHGTVKQPGPRAGSTRKIGYTERTPSLLGTDMTSTGGPGFRKSPERQRALAPIAGGQRRQLLRDQDDRKAEPGFLHRPKCIGGSTDRPSPTRIEPSRRTTCFVISDISRGQPMTPIVAASPRPSRSHI